MQLKGMLMTSVTATKLRNNLGEYLDRLQNGEEILIIRHSEIIGTLMPIQNEPAGSGAAIAKMLDHNKKLFSQNKGLTEDRTATKEQYHEALNKKYS